MTPTEELERLAASITQGPWKIHKCLCGHPSCAQFTISTQGSVGFDEADAQAIALLPELLTENIHLRKKVVLLEERLSARRASGPRVNESALHTLWTMGNRRLSFDAFKARVLSALEPATQPLTAEAAAQVLLDKWMHGEFEDDADAIAQDPLDYGGDAADVIEAWLRALTAKGGQHE